jgi:flagellar basal-body rod modification protein FlgD
MSAVSSSNSLFSQSSTGTQSSSSSTSSSSAANNLSPNENTFLKLLVSQLQAQDPLNPADSTQFVTQLAQFSSLEQLIQISQNTGTVAKAVAPPTTSSTGSADGSGQSTSGAASGDNSGQAPSGAAPGTNNDQTSGITSGN